jgi:hypothetical protein
MTTDQGVRLTLAAGGSTSHFRVNRARRAVTGKSATAAATLTEEARRRRVEVSRWEVAPAALPQRQAPDEWRASIANHVEPLIGLLPVEKIDTSLVLRVLEPLWQTKPETASRVRGRIEAILPYASARSWCDGPNPAVRRGHLQRQAATGQALCRTRLPLGARVHGRVAPEGQPL